MERSKINLNLLGIKVQTKNEFYKLSTEEAKLYLLSRKETSIFFIRGIVKKEKKRANWLSIHKNLGSLYRWNQDLISPSDR